MNEEGFIKLHRSILNWDWADDCTVFYFFVRLIFAANYQSRNWHGMTIERGQFVTSIDKLCELTKLSKPTVKRCLSCLTGTGEIKETIVANRYRIITVVNYDKYQQVGKNFTDQSDTVGKKTTDTKKRVGKKSTNPRGAVGKKSTNQGGEVGKNFTPGGKKSTNSPTNSPTPTKERKKYSSPLREKNTADTPACPEGGVRVPPEQKEPTEPKRGGWIVPLKELLTYAETVPDSRDSLVLEFHGGFEQSGTAMPSEWQELYVRYVVADEEHRRQFIELLMSGELRERWGCV